MYKCREVISIIYVKILQIWEIFKHNILGETREREEKKILQRNSEE